MGSVTWAVSYGQSYMGDAAAAEEHPGGRAGHCLLQYVQAVSRDVKVH